MRVLVVTPTLGHSPWLMETVQSVAKLADVCAHVLVAPANEVGNIVARFPRATVISEGDGARGMYAAINTASRRSTDWDALTYINDDDMLLPGFMRVVRAVESRQARMMVAYGRVRLIDSSGKIVGTVPASRWPALNSLLYDQQIEPLYQQGAVMTRTAFEYLGGFDESLKLCGDTEILARACQAGITFAHATHDEVAIFRLRAGQLSRNREAMAAERAIINRKLGLPVERLLWRHHLARWAFRAGNIGVYFRRMRQHGWVSMLELQDHM